MFDVNMVKPKPMLHIVGGRGLSLYFFVCWSRGAVFVSSHFGIAQSPCNGLHCPTSLDGVGWKPYYVPLN